MAIGGFILKAIAFILVALLIILALPFRYSMAASWRSGEGSFDWRLTWAGVVSLDKIIKKRLATETSGEEEPEKKKAKKSKKSVVEKNKPGNQSEGSGTHQVLRESDSNPTEKMAEVAASPSTEDISATLPSSASPISETAKVFLREGEELSKTAADPETESISAAESEQQAPQALSAGEAENDQPVGEAAKSSEKVAAKEIEEETAPSEAEQEVSPREMARILWEQRSWLLSWLSRFWGTLHLTPLKIAGACGLGDPYATSELFRKLIILRAILPRGIRLDVEPHYMECKLDLQISLAGWLSPLHVLVQVIMLLLDRTTWKLIRSLGVG